jgi:outer membrane murein-binding lipoprotein Lpp
MTRSIPCILAAPLLLAGCANSQSENVLSKDGEDVQVTYAQYNLQNVRGFVEPLIKAAGYQCDRIDDASAVKVAGVVDQPGTILEQPSTTQYMKVSCADGRSYQIARYVPENRTVVRPWSHELIGF